MSLMKHYGTWFWLSSLPPFCLLCPHPSTTPADDGPDSFFDYRRDLRYLELFCAPARNSDWHLRLYGNRHIDRCISMIQGYCDSESPMEHAFCIASSLLRIAQEQTSDASAHECIRACLVWHSVKSNASTDACYWPDIPELMMMLHLPVHQMSTHEHAICWPCQCMVIYLCGTLVVTMYLEIRNFDNDLYLRKLLLVAEILQYVNSLY